jgi:hypothetical protein
MAKKRNETKIRKAEKWLKARRNRIKKIKASDRNRQQKPRRIVIVAARVVLRMNKDANCRSAFDGLVANKKNPKRFQVKEGASKHLPILRFLGLGKHSGSARRFADWIDACLRDGGSLKEVGRFVRKHGFAELCRKVRGE